VAGTPTYWRFDASHKVLSVAYSSARADGPGTFPAGSETVVAVPAVQYPAGYAAQVTGATVVSPPDAPVLRVRSTGPGPVTITVLPRAHPEAVGSVSGNPRS
jgi:endoglycosylceramidase